MRVLEQLVERARALLLAAGEDGIPRWSFPALFGDDRMARAAITEVRLRGWLPVVVTRRGEHTIYRVAQSDEEYRRYRASLISRIRSLADVIDGLDRAWEGHAGRRVYQLRLWDEEVVDE